MNGLSADAAGSFWLGEQSVTRLGYGAVQLAGPNMYGPALDVEEAKRVLRRAVELGVNHIDTSDFYGPHIVNEAIRKALHPYPEELTVVTKVGARWTPAGTLTTATSREELTQAVHENLRNLGVETLDVVNLRPLDASNPLQPPRPGYPIEEQFGVLAELRAAGMIRHLGLSNVSVDHLRRAQAIAPVVCVQNLYNISHRAHDQLLAECEANSIAFVPFFPVSYLTPEASSVLGQVADELDASIFQVALAWLLARSPNILVIPGTASIAHLEQNIAAGAISLPRNVIAKLDAGPRFQLTQ